MQDAYRIAKQVLRRAPSNWLVTGAAGFIGSNLVETLLNLGQDVIGLDNFATGHRSNLLEIEAAVGPDAWARFRFIEGDIRDLDTCRTAVAGCDCILHQAALGSVPRSIDDPITTNGVNVGGFLNMLVAARDEGVTRFVYAASSSTYGDQNALPKVEHQIGRPLSPYAITKYVDELYADVFGRTYDFTPVGLRYFNVFGARQDPQGAYAAVIPTWVAAMLKGDPVIINGDGETSRDFCYVENAVQANLLAAVARPEAMGEVFNVAVGQRTTLNTLLKTIRAALESHGVAIRGEPVHRPFRAGDVRHSLADINKARRLLGYEPAYEVGEGIELAMPWYLDYFSDTETPFLAKSSIASDRMPYSERSVSK